MKFEEVPAIPEDKIGLALIPSLFRCSEDECAAHTHFKQQWSSAAKQPAAIWQGIYGQKPY
jgi:hypothetical protein